MSSTTLIDTDIRNLFALGKIDDYEKLKIETKECLIVLKGIETRIQDRLHAYDTASTTEVSY